MKQTTAFFRIFLLMTVLASLVACEGGSFSDPGREAALGGSGGEGRGDYDGGDDDDDGGSSGSSSKPSELSSNASKQQALNKLDEIEDYCDSHPGNGGPLGAADSLWIVIDNMSNAAWDVAGSGNVGQINNIIAQLK
jgi:hypothetical protein